MQKVRGPESTFVPIYVRGSLLQATAWQTTSAEFNAVCGCWLRRVAERKVVDVRFEKRAKLNEAEVGDQRRY